MCEELPKTFKGTIYAECGALLADKLGVDMVRATLLVAQIFNPRLTEHAKKVASWMAENETLAAKVVKLEREPSLRELELDEKIEPGDIFWATHDAEEPKRFHAALSIGFTPRKSVYKFRYFRPSLPKVP